MRLIAFVLAAFATFSTFGINRADSVNVLFGVGQHRVDLSFDSNREKLDHFMSTLKSYSPSDIEGIEIRAYTSPDGTSRINELLSRQRCDALADYIISNSGIAPDLIRRMPEGIAWDALTRLVKDTPDVPAREQVLDILEHTPVWVTDAKGKVVGSRKSRLMALRGGVPYRWMLTHLFPQLRNGVGIVVAVKDGAHHLQPAEEPAEIEEVVEITDTVIAEEEPVETPPTPEIPEEETPVEEADEYIYTPDRFALKTNLLYDLALTPNLEVEWRIKPHWSVALDGLCAWWGGGTRKYRLAVVAPEGRYHFKLRDDWHGMYIGALVGGGLYDLENRKNGVRGEGVMAGASFGYTWRLTRHLSMEAGVAAGYMFTRYKEYRPLDGHFLYQRTKDLHYFGPLRVRLALVWRFGHKKIKLTNQRQYED